jgi:hypothetical protein
MVNETALRTELVALLGGGQAHPSAEQALSDVPPPLRGRRPAAGTPTIFEELEHMRIAQEDIIRYTLDPSWKSPPWPEGYWPAGVGETAEEAWEASRGAFLRDLGELKSWVRDTDIELASEVPHGEGRTYLRQVLLVADHNGYHCGQIVQARKMLGGW